MAEIRAFRGARYNREVVGDLSLVVTPPYDVISPEDEERYYEQSPYSIIRLILPRDEGSKYRSAAATLHDWLSAGALVCDDEPCLYACVQEFMVEGQRKSRLGFTCLVRLEDYGHGILPHENIMSGPRQDRLKLLRTTRANFDSVFGLHSDGRVEGILRPFPERKPDASAVDKDGVRCSLWKVSDPESIRSIMEALSGESVLIADGHHRYAAALAYRDEMRAQVGESDPDAPHEFVMMTLVSLTDPGLVVFPTHRLVRDVPGFRADSFLNKVSEYFDVTQATADRLAYEVEALDSHHHIFGLYLGHGRSCVLRLKPSVRPEEVIPGPGSDALKRLDVTVLHSLTLEQLLGIGAKELAAATNVSYTRDIAGGMRSVDQGENQMLILMNPTRVEEVREVAGHGERMPQKSTYFYPKLLTGMVMRVMPRLTPSR